MKLRPVMRSAIGLDVGARGISAVQLAGVAAAGNEGPRWRVEAAVRVARPSGAGRWPQEDELVRLWEVLDRQGFTGRRVVVAAPETSVFSATLELPPRSSGAPVEELARQEIARSMKKDASEVEVATWDVPRPPRAGGDGAGGSLHVLAVGLAHSDAEPLLDAVEQSGSRGGRRFEVEAIECRCCAMARACEGLVKGVGGVSAIVDVGESAVSIAVMHSGVVVYDRVVRDAGLERLRDQVRTELGGGRQGAEHSEAEDLVMASVTSGRIAELPAHTAAMVQVLVEGYGAQVVQELRSVIAYSIHRYPGAIGPVLLLGPGAGIGELGEKIRKDLDLVTRIVTLGHVAASGVGETAVSRAASDAAMTVAAGLAMRAGAAALRRAA